MDFARPLTLYFVAGETSGDNHGAALIAALRELRHDLHFTGRGGPRMQELAGAQFMDWTAAAAVVGLSEVLKKYGYFRREFAATLRAIEQEKPDAVVLIDYPGFNLRLARALKRRRAATRIIYYISPQVWAWNRGRIVPMARMLDMMLCIFPFEEALYRASGLRTILVGHPMIEALEKKRVPIARERKLVGLFPGSRHREVRRLFPLMLETMHLIHARDPAVRFAAAAASPPIARQLEEMFARRGLEPAVKFTVTPDASELMQTAGAALVASGTATLEAAFFRLPFALVYKVSWLTYLAGRLLIQVKYLGMPNILADKEIVREFIQHRAAAPAIARETFRLLGDENARQEMTKAFDAVIAQLGGAGASARAADAILQLFAEPAR